MEMDHLIIKRLIHYLQTEQQNFYITLRMDIASNSKNEAILKYGTRNFI